MSIIEQVSRLRYVANGMEIGSYSENILIDMLNKAAETIESLSAKLQAENCGGGWTPCNEPPKDDREVLIFNGKSYSVGYYDGKTWINAIHPVEWQEIHHES